MIYLFAFDPERVNAQTVQETIEGNQIFSDWWHGLGNIYFLASGEPFTAIQKTLAKDLPTTGTGHILLQIDLQHTDPQIPPAVKDWVQALPKG